MRDHIIGQSIDPPPDATRRRLTTGLLAAPAAGVLAACGRDETHHVDDVSQLNRTIVSSVIRPRSSAALSTALAASRGAVSIGGGRYSMGGQIVAEGSLHIDMRGMNRLLWLDVAARRVRVQAGMRWRDLQALIDPHDLSVSIMQSYSNFSIGGSVSVNCHGRYVGKGPLIGSLLALTLIDARGQALALSRTSHPELFHAVIGGYGGLGVISEVELGLDVNSKIGQHAEYVALRDYPAYFRERVANNPDAVLHNANLAPPHYDKPLAVTWTKTDAALTIAERLVPEHADYSRDQNLIWASSELPLGDRVRDHELNDKLLHNHPVVWRNHEASLDARSLEPRTRFFSTYLLQEYFIPTEQFLDFAKALQSVLNRFETHVLNVSIRHSLADTESLLRWAPHEVFAFVIYYKQRAYPAADDASARWTRQLINAALASGGRYYLPYRLHATEAQFERAYPEVTQFAAIKSRVDPQGRFRNMLWDRYLR